MNHCGVFINALVYPENLTKLPLFFWCVRFVEPKAFIIRQWNIRFLCHFILLLRSNAHSVRSLNQELPCKFLSQSSTDYSVGLPSNKIRLILYLCIKINLFLNIFHLFCFPNEPMRLLICFCRSDWLLPLSSLRWAVIVLALVIPDTCQFLFGYLFV